MLVRDVPIIRTRASGRGTLSALETVPVTVPLGCAPSLPPDKVRPQRITQNRKEARCTCSSYCQCSRRATSVAFFGRLFLAFCKPGPGTGERRSGETQNTRLSRSIWGSDGHRL